MGPESEVKKITELLSVAANNPLLKRERRAWHNSSNAMTTKDMHFLLTHVHMLSPLDAMSTHFRGSFCNRWVGGGSRDSGV